MEPGRPERGDVPGWVLITLMTAGLVTALWALAGPQLGAVFTDAISSVTGPDPRTSVVPPLPRGTRHAPRDVVDPREGGAAVADFVLVSGLVSLLFLAVLQVGLALHIRNTLIACASEGARYGARADREPGDGVARAQQLIRASLADRYAANVTASTTSAGGVSVVRLRVLAPLPLLGPLGPDRTLDVQARAFAEDQ